MLEPFTLPAPAPHTRSSRELVVLAVAAVAAGLWIFLFKLAVFRGLGTTDDLFQFAQLSISWLDGQFLHDNHYGNHLSIHTYFLCPLLAVLVVPFGAAGLLVAEGLAAGAGIYAMGLICRRYGLPAAVSVPFAVLLTLMPLSLNTYQDEIYGFHIELLVPALALWLSYFLLCRRWIGSILLGAALLAVKEDSPLIVALVAGIVLLEDFAASRTGSDGRDRRFNRPALVTLVAGIAALPLLLSILHHQTPGDFSPGSFSRLKTVNGGAINGPIELLSYFFGTAGSWLKSYQVVDWLKLSFAATLGLVLLRPHLLVAGLVTTLIAWLMQSDILWAPRFAHALAFFQLTACLGLVSAIRVTGSGPRIRTALAVAIGTAVILSFYQQARAVPDALRYYSFHPNLRLTAAETDDANELFKRYDRESKKGEPVMPSLFLFRYAKVQDLYWHPFMAGRPKPKWILWDRQESSLGTLRTSLNLCGADLSDYRLLDQRGRFLLYRAKDTDGAR